VTKSERSRSSEYRFSRIVRLFAERAARSANCDPKSTLKKLLSEMKRAVGWTRKTPRLEAAQTSRGILHTHYMLEGNDDGRLEPIGTCFDNGFKLYLNARAPKTRVRFTQAHEICHTFFYQFVPELKFQPHLEDAQEERLCNFGAAELLMPERSLREDSHLLPRSIDSLSSLACRYGVSIEAMISRLRYLRLWNCELYLWHRETGGEFVLDRVIGERYQPWTWTDQSVPDYAWKKGRLSGHSHLYCDVDRNSKHFKSISFDARRQGFSLVVLSGSSQRERTMPLWDRPQGRSPKLQ
jgi:Zn-dependent peptidase ImmA (M78 family)